MEKEKKVSVFDFEEIIINEENITKKDLLKKLEEVLEGFTSKDELSSVHLRAIVRVEDSNVLPKVASVLSDLVRDADSACR